MGTQPPHLLKNLLVATATGVVFFVFLEIVLRMTHLFDARVSCFKPDSVIGYRFVPHAEYYFHKENPKPIVGRINNFGWRDVDWTMEKSPGTFRIATVGDSFVEAFQVERESTFVRIAEQMLASRMNVKNIQMMNFGRSGFTQTDELLILQSDVLKFSPDVVVVFFLPINDIEDVRKETSPEPDRPFFVYDEEDGKLVLDTSFKETSKFRAKMVADVLRQNSALLSLIVERYTSSVMERHKRDQEARVAARGHKLPGYMTICCAHPDEELARGYALNKILIGRIAQVCRAARVDFLFACLPTDAYIYEREKEYLQFDSTFNHTFFEDDLQQLSSSLNIHYLGLQRLFRKEYERNHRPLHWEHLNYEGHRVIANALVNSLIPLVARPDSTQ